MRQVLGLAFIVVSIWIMLYGFVWISNFVAEPEIFPLYQMLSELPDSERTMQADAGEMILPISLYKMGGLGLAVLLMFVALGIVKMFFNAGVTLLAPKVEDSLDKLVKKLKEPSKPSNRGIES